MDKQLQFRTQYLFCSGFCGQEGEKINKQEKKQATQKDNKTQRRLVTVRIRGLLFSFAEAVVALILFEEKVLC